VESAACYGPGVSTSRHFSVTTAGVLVLGGVAAAVLATVIALGERGARSNTARSKFTATAATASAPASVPSIEGEYLLDVSEATSASQLVPADVGLTEAAARPPGSGDR
jgi:hypothetical protein